MDLGTASVRPLVPCGLIRGFGILVTINPTTGNGIVAADSNYAQMFPQGVQINPRANFYKAKTAIIQGVDCPRQVVKRSGYLGLEFQIKGKTHYGWALVNVFARCCFPPNDLETSLIGFAYETMPGSPINSGQTSGEAADPTAPAPNRQTGSLIPPVLLFNLDFCQKPEVRLRVDSTTKYFSAVSRFLSDFRLSRKESYIELPAGKTRRMRPRHQRTARVSLPFSQRTRRG